MSVHGAYQGFMERVLFRGKRTRRSEAFCYVLANLFLVLGVFSVLLNTVVYNWTGALYAHGFHLNTPLDDIIPFAPAWAIFYLYLFYPLSALTIAYFTFVEYRRAYALAFSLILINVVADVVYAVFPVTTDIYRQQLLAHPLDTPFARAMYAHFASDPSFNCFPSLHAAVAVICFYAWYRYARVKPNKATRALAIGMFVVAVGVVFSTLFVKQHYIADEIAGIALGWAVGRWVFDRAEKADS
jgi:membrane-associated phospholipid phosphatase